MYSCPKCNSEKLQKRGIRTNKHHKMFRQFKCKSCSGRFEVAMPVVEESDSNTQALKYVVTYYQKNTEINYKFLRTLINYANTNSAELLVLTNQDEFGEDFPFARYFVPKNFTIGEDIIAYSKLNISPTAENPLSGLDSLSKGKSLIIGHTSMALKMLPVFGASHPIMLHTTGTISVPNYNTEKKAGAKAEHNHSYSAIMLEMDSDCFHFRQLNSGEDGTFYDVDKYYDGENVSESGGCEAIILGDVHVSESDDAVIDATYRNKDSIVNVTKPKRVIMHDVLSVNGTYSHHSSSSFITRYGQYVHGEDSIVKELNQTCQFLVDNTPNFVQENVIVSSNHHDHLAKWMDSTFDKLHDYKNAKIYHWLMYKTLDNIESGVPVNPFKDYFCNFYGNTHAGKVTNFLGRDDLYFVGDILLSTHSDKGFGGSRGSVTQYSKAPYKMVIGHGHTPSILKGCWMAGTCTPTRLGYTAGTPTNWLNSHVIIHNNFRRQMINIIKGKWRIK